MKKRALVLVFLLVIPISFAGFFSDINSWLSGTTDIAGIDSTITAWKTGTPPVICDDTDGDGFGVGQDCGPKVDCDDTDPAVNPDAVEICGNGIDDDCDGRIDDDDDDCITSVCGDGVCDIDEDETSCLKDCEQWGFMSLDDYSLEEYKRRHGNPGHPNLFFNMKELDEIRSKIDREPFKKQYDWLRFQARCSHGGDWWENNCAVWDTPDIPVYTGTDIATYRDQFSDKAAPQALKNALLYYLSEGRDSDEDRVKYKDLAIGIMLDWSRNNLNGKTNIDEFTGDDKNGNAGVGLQIGKGAYHFAAAYDLLYDFFSPGEHEDMHNFFNNVYELEKQSSVRYWCPDCPARPAICHRFNNHQSSHLATMAAIAFVMDDTERIDETLKGWTVPLKYPNEEGVPIVDTPNNWKAFMDYAIFMYDEYDPDNPDEILGCDRESGNRVYDGEVFDRFRHFDNGFTDPDEDGVFDYCHLDTVQGTDHSNCSDNNPDVDPGYWHKNKKGYGYSFTGLRHLALVAEMAYHYGIDLYNYTSEPDGEKLLLSAQYLVRYFDSFPTFEEYRDKRIILPFNSILYPHEKIKGEEAYLYELMTPNMVSNLDIYAYRYKDRYELTKPQRAIENKSITRRDHDLMFFGKVFDSEEIAWTFNYNDISEGWVPAYGPERIEYLKVKDGLLSFHATASPTIAYWGTNLRAEDYSRFVINLSVEGDIPDNEQPYIMFFWGSDDQNFRGDRNVSIDISKIGSFEQLNVPIDHPLWEGQIGKLRITLRNLPETGGRALVQIDEIKLVR